MDMSASLNHVYLHKGAFLGVFPIRGDRFRIITSASQDQTSREEPPSVEFFRQVLQTAARVSCVVHAVTWSSWYQIKSRMSSTYREGHIFLGGDAVHIHSPAGGQGMNTGIQHMVNLCWKLALVLRGQASVNLLATYEQERVPVARKLLRATQVSSVLTSSKKSSCAIDAASSSPPRDKFSVCPKKANASVSEVAVNYQTSALSLNHATTSAKLRAGDRVPDVRVRYREGDLLSELRLPLLCHVSKLTLLAVQADVPYSLPWTSIASWLQMVSIVHVQPPVAPEAARNFLEKFGKVGGLYVTRLDLYMGFAGGPHSSRALVHWLERWFSNQSTAHGDVHV